MKRYDAIELVGKAEIEESARKRIATTGVRGLSFEKAQELGLFTRISLLLSTMHTTIMAAYKVYKQVDDLLDAFGGRRNDIAKACKDFERAADKFIGFWTDYYSKGGSLKDVDYEISNMYRNVFKLTGVPEKWVLGGAQSEENTNADATIVIDNGDKLLRLSGSTINEKVSSCKESWCVTKYDVESQTQVCVHSDMDKSSAAMIAKRLSSEDKCNIYTISQVLEVEKSETVVTPTKAFQANGTIGKIGKTIKM